MKTYYEYEALNLRKNPVYIRKFNRHNSRGRVHWHEPLELLYFVEGTAITSCNLQEYKAKQGCILIVNGNELHTGIISQNNSAFYCIQFDPFFFHNLIGNEYVIFENFFKDKDCTDVLDRLISVYMQPRSIKNIIEYKKISHEFFALLVERHTKNILDEEHYKKHFKRLDTFHHIIDYIEENYMKELSVPMIAAEFNISASHLAHFFKQYSGKSLIEYVNELRIQKAKLFLEREELAITDIALKVGFSDINYFSRKFKAVTGKTPTEYKKSLKREV